MSEKEELPLDVVEQILIRMDVKDLLRWKSVCKSWQSLISTPPFVKAHLNHSYLNDRHCLEFGHRKIRGSFRFPLLIVGSCNGLVCVSTFSLGCSSEFVVTNPSIREAKKLPRPVPPQDMPENSLDGQAAYRCCGFGYDSAIDDYKVVVGLRTDKSTILFHVLTLKSNTWKFIGKTVNYVSGVWDRGGILCDGALHWFMEDAMGNTVIISLDLSTHEFKEIPLPATEYDIYYRYQYKLGIIEECLCMYRCWNPMYEKTWVLRSNKWEVYNDIDQENSGKYLYDVVHRLTIPSRAVDSTTLQTTSYAYSFDDARLVPSIGGDNIFVKSLVSPNPHPLVNNYASSRDRKIMGVSKAVA